VLALTAPLVLLSIVFMSGRTRTDHRIYGRYNDAVLWPVLLVAIAWVLQVGSVTRRRAAIGLLSGVAGAIVVSSVAIERIDGDALRDSVGVRAMIAGLMAVVGTHRSIALVPLTLAAVAVLVALVLLSVAPRLRPALAVAAIALLGVAGVRTHSAMSLRLNSWQPATEVVAIDAIIPRDAPIGFRFVPASDHPRVSWDDQRRRAQLYQFALPGHRFERDRGIDDGVGPYVFAPAGDPVMKAAGATVLWTDPKVQEALWLEPAEPKAEKASALSGG
jgi:hypothetical protein